MKLSCFPFGSLRLDRATIRYLSLRLIVVVVAFWFIVTLLFAMIHLAPGDPLGYRYQSGAGFTPEMYAELRQHMGLDKPLYEQYFIYFGQLLRGDLGQSFLFDQSVLSIIVERLPATLILMLTSIFMGIFVGTFLGIISARKPNSAWDHAVRFLSLVGYSTPEFWLAILLILVFSLYLGFFPLGGMADPRLMSGSWSYYLSLGWHAVLPIFALSLFYIAIFARYSRTSILEQSTENYVITARAKGLDERTAFNKHVLRNSLLPVVTMIGVSFTYIFGGAVLIETVFSWPGIGWLMYDAVMARDYPLVQGIFLFATVSVIVVNLLVDVVYGFLDPRVRGQAVTK